MSAATIQNRRRWLKLWSREWLGGSIRFDLEADERGVWADLLAMANESRNPGVIQANPLSGYPRPWIANTLNITNELLDRTLQKCIAADRLAENHAGITILNWGKYQTIFDMVDKSKPLKKSRSSQKEKAYGEFRNIFLTDGDYGKLIAKFGEQGTKERIEALSTGIKSKGYKYKSHYATILNWERKDKRDEHGTGYKPPKSKGASKPGRTIDAEGEAGAAD